MIRNDWSLYPRAHHIAKKTLPWFLGLFALLMVFIWALPDPPAPSIDEKRAAYDAYATRLNAMLAASNALHEKVRTAATWSARPASTVQAYGAFRDAQKLNDGLMMKSMMELTVPPALHDYSQRLDDAQSKIESAFQARAKAYEYGAAFLDDGKPSQAHEEKANLAYADHCIDEAMNILDAIATDLNRHPSVEIPKTD